MLSDPPPPPDVDALLLADPLATVRAIAAVTGVPRSTVDERRRRLIAAGRLPALTRRERGHARNRARFGTVPDARRARDVEYPPSTFSLRWVRDGTPGSLDITVGPLRLPPVTAENADQIRLKIAMAIARAAWRAIGSDPVAARVFPAEPLAGGWGSAERLLVDPDP
jgi:hypothetical protein